MYVPATASVREPTENGAAKAPTSDGPPPKASVDLIVAAVGTLPERSSYPVVVEHDEPSEPPAARIGVEFQPEFK